MKKTVQVCNLGVMDYQEAYDLQKKLLEKRQQNLIPDTILFVEHPKVITMGIRAKEENIIVDETYLKTEGVSVYHIRRGGDVTYHGPGQIVGYFIVNIKELGLGVKDFVSKIEEVMITLLDQYYQIKAGRINGHTGVWVGNEKITAIGVEIKRWVSMHGFALNVNTNLDDFNMIVPCGITDKGVTSIQKITSKIIENDLIVSQLKETISHVFDIELILIDLKTLNG